jgi:hypothetical protein
MNECPPVRVCGAQVGKFYEIFHMDADVAVKELELIYMKARAFSLCICVCVCVCLSVCL